MLNIKIKFSKIYLILLTLFTFSTLHAENALSVELALKNEKNGSIIITLTNTSTKDIRVLKWNTPLENRLNANLFLVKNGKEPIAYLGRLLKRGKPTDSDYTVFGAGEKRTVVIELSKYYKMIKKGDYSVSYNGSFTLEGIVNQKSILHKAKVTNSTLNFLFTPVEKKN